LPEYPFERGAATCQGYELVVTGARVTISQRLGQIVAKAHLRRARGDELGEHIGRALGERWKFPTHLVDAVRCHHDERLTPENDGLSGIIAQCNRLALHYGLYCGYDMDLGDITETPADLAAVEEACGGIDRILDRAFSFIESASGAPDRWYAAVA
jgi:hypothetical protein